MNTPSGWALAEWYPSKPAGLETKKKKRKKKKKKSGQSKKKVAPKDGKKAASKSKPPKVETSRMTWKEFSTPRMKAGQPMKEISNEWEKYKEANA